MLERVTITGADDDTDISELIKLNIEFPFVEWGILVSKVQEGGSRFPSRPWISKFLKHLDFVKNLGPRDPAISMHMCGGWVKELLMGHLDWNELPKDLWYTAGRIQINTHAEIHRSTVMLMDNLKELGKKNFIFQLDGVNDHLLAAANGYEIHAEGLIDSSHGAGVLPVEWSSHPLQKNVIYLGYAGGLGPENIAQELPKIDRLVNNLYYWIDMEGNIRTDEKLDLVKVRSVLEQVRASGFLLGWPERG